MSPCYYCEADDDICKTCIHSNTYEDPYAKLEAVEKQRDELLAFTEEVRRTGNTRLASMAISVVANVKGGV